MVVHCPSCRTALAPPAGTIASVFRARCVCGTEFLVRDGAVIVPGAVVGTPVARPATAAPAASTTSATAPAPAPAAAKPTVAVIATKPASDKPSAAPRARAPRSGSPSGSVSFLLNGTAVTVTDVDPTMTLNDYLRYEQSCTDVKKMCGEGGCGACAVVLSYPDPTTGAPQHLAANSCLRPLASVDGYSITTPTGIGSLEKGFHPVQERLADNNGSQCGSCTPGMVVSMYSLLQSNPTPTALDIESQLDGNLCRCTGYRPIFQAFQTFASDIEDLAVKKPGCTGSCSTCKADCHSHKDTKTAEATPRIKYDAQAHKSIPLMQHKPRPLNFVKNGVSWWAPVTLPDLYSLLASNPGPSTRMLVGNTSTGIYKNELTATTLIDIKNIPELQTVTVSSTGITFGAAVTLTKIMNTLEANAALSTYYPILLTHMQKVANVPVRNVGCWAGNFMTMLNNTDFPSDLFTIFMACNSTVTVGSQSGVVSLSLDQLLTYNMANANALLSLTVPVNQPGDVFLTFKTRLRHQNSHAIVNAGFLANVSNGVVNGTPSIVYGGIAPVAVRAVQAQAALANQNVSSTSTLSAVLSALQSELTPDEGPGKVAYRSSQICTLFYKFYLNLLPSIPSNLQTASTVFVRPVSIGVENYSTDPNIFPINAPIPTLTARIQTSGEAPFTADIPVARTGLCAAFVISTVASGNIVSIDASAALAAPGVVRVLTAADVPAAGQNNFNIHGVVEEIFASSTIEYYGQSVALVIADTQAHADTAALLVNVSYTNVGAPILTIDEAIAAGSYIPAPQIVPLQVGNVDEAFNSSDVVITGQVSTSAQYHFFMQTHATVAIPTANNTMLIHSETQDPNMTGKAVAQAVGLSNSAIVSDVARVGGAYGGKIDRCNLVACAVAVAARLLNVEVRCQANLNTVMAMCGKRHPEMGTYKVGVNSSGKVTAVQMQYHIDAGWVGVTAAGTVLRSMAIGDNCYNIPNWDVSGVVCKTNTPTNTAMRGPGDVPGIFFIEHIMDHAATAIGMDPTQLRMANFYQVGDVTPYGMPLPQFPVPDMVAQMTSTADLNQRVAAVAAYNAANTWTKQGIALVPVKYGVEWSGNKFGVMVNINAGDGSVAVTHSGVEMGQGINVKVAQVAAATLGVPLDMITVNTTSTAVNANASTTGGSIGSGMNCQACLEACQKLNQTLVPIKRAMPEASWPQMIAAAWAAGVDLDAKGWFAPVSPNIFQYNAFGLACTQVQIDVLTGDTQILRSDIIYDCGRSLNPAIDIGQVEGAFVMGIGYFLTEELLFDATSGALISNGTWEYKPPSSQDIPIDFRVSLLKNSNNPLGVLQSKASGEPPYCLASSVLLAVQRAIAAARADQGLSGYFELDAPATVDQVQQACGVNVSSLTF